MVIVRVFVVWCFMNFFRLIGSAAIALVGMALLLAPDLINIIRQQSNAVPDQDELKKLPFGKRY